MNFKTTIFLLLVFVGIGAYVIFTRHAGPSSEPAVSQTADTGKKLIDFSADEVTRVAITPAAGAAIVLEKTAGTWRLTQPTAAPADAGAVSALISSLVEMSSTTQVAADQKAAAGLDKPPYTVQLTGPAGKTTTIAFGNKPAIGDALDVIVNNGDKPDVVSASIYSQLEQPASAYRKTSLVAVAPNQIRQVKIERPAIPAVDLEKRGDTWELLGKRGFTLAKADSTAMGDITTALSGLSAKEFVDEKHPLSYFGLAQPFMTVWFSTSPRAPFDATQPAGTTILFGSPVDMTKADVYASIDGQIVKLPNVTADTFRKSPLDLRDKTILDIDPSTVTSATIVADRTPEAKALGPNGSPRWNITYERKAESHVAGPPLPTTGPATMPSTAPAMPASHWNVVSGMRVNDADDAKVDTLLAIFHPLLVQKYIDSAATTQPASTYDITIKAGPTRTETIKITDQGGDNPLIGSYGDAIFELDRALLPKINGDAGAK